jgi:pyroglutamyl-peptidase
MEKCLCSGFEPFGGSPLNPSEQVVRALDGITLDGGEIGSVILPVDGTQGPACLIEAVERVQPDVVISLGEATHRAAVSVERVALNLLDYRIADNAGKQVVDQAIAPGGPAAYFSTLPVREICQAVVTAGVPCELSLSAGAFLCNQVMYTMLHYFACQGEGRRSGFIHLPALPQQVAPTSMQSPVPSMSLDMDLVAVRAAIVAIFH